MLVRHAIAEERGPAWRDDNLRPLTGEGRERMRKAAIGLARLITPDVILTSPLTRAVQTAEILHVAWPKAPVRRCDSLADGDHDALLAAAVAGGEECVAAVGHEPWCSEALSYLLTGSAEHLLAPSKKGGAAVISFAGAPRAGRGVLEWFLPPRVLRALNSAAREG